MEYKLVTCYPVERDTGTAWLVYGHAAPGMNESLGEYSTQSEALADAFRTGAPVMLSRNYDAVLMKLAA